MAGVTNLYTVAGQQVGIDFWSNMVVDKEGTIFLTQFGLYSSVKSARPVTTGLYVTPLTAGGAGGVIVMVLRLWMDTMLFSIGPLKILPLWTNIW